MIYDRAFQILTIEKSDHLSLKDGTVLISGESDVQIALSSITCIIFYSQNTTVSVALLSSLSENNIPVIVCNKNGTPIGQYNAISGNNINSGRIQKQAKWEKALKDTIWQQIVKNKISNSAYTLEKNGMPDIASKLKEYENRVMIGDFSNKEAISAKAYFAGLFGYSFNRNKETPVNAALNYGYAIFASLITRAVISFGYSPCLGIHHKSSANPRNLSYDLIEPFRCIVDNYVFNNIGDAFDSDNKRDLVLLSEGYVLYSGKKCKLTYAINTYCCDVLKALNTGKLEIKPIKPIF